MKKVSLFLILLLSIFSIKNVSASNLSSAPINAYLSDNSTIYKIMSDSNTTCSSYLDSINYDIFSQLNLGDKEYVIDFHYNSQYVSGESFTFTYFQKQVDGYGSSPYLKNIFDNGTISHTDVILGGYWDSYTYTIDCRNGQSSLSSDKTSVYNHDVYILEKRDIGYEFFPSYFQSSFGDVTYASNDSNIQQNQGFNLVGVYNNELEEVKKIDAFIGSDYYSNNLVLGAGIGLIPFYSALSGDFVNVDIPYTGDYSYYYLNNESSLFFTPTENFYEEGIDTQLYIRPVILDQTLSTEQLYNIFGSIDIKLGVYSNYEDLNTKTNYSFYWNNSYNDFFIIPSNYITSTIAMYQVAYYNQATVDKTALNQMIIYYNPRAWNVKHYTRKSSAKNVSISGVNGTKTYSREQINSSRMDTLNNNNVQNKPQYGNTDGSNIQGGTGTSFFDGLLGNIKGIGNFIGSVSSGIAELTSSISSLITMAFSTLDALPVAISSVFYLCFLLTMVAIILKIFL